MYYTQPWFSHSALSHLLVLMTMRWSTQTQWGCLPLDMSCGTLMFSWNQPAMWVILQFIAVSRYFVVEQTEIIYVFNWMKFIFSHAQTNLRWGAHFIEITCFFSRLTWPTFQRICRSVLWNLKVPTILLSWTCFSMFLNQGSNKVLPGQSNLVPERNFMFTGDQMSSLCWGLKLASKEEATCLT